MAILKVNILESDQPADSFLMIQMNEKSLERIPVIWFST